MEQRPIKRNINIVRLSREHHSGLLFCWKIRQGLKHGVDTDRIVKYVNYFWQKDLQNHFAEEEEIVFSNLQDDLVQKALDDHKKISDQVKNSSSVSKEDAIDVVENLANLVDEHIRYEERVLFPHLENELSLLQLEAIGIRLNASGAVELKEKYQDEFWSR